MNPPPPPKCHQDKKLGENLSLTLPASHGSGHVSAHLGLWQHHSNLCLCPLMAFSFVSIKSPSSFSFKDTSPWI